MPFVRCPVCEDILTFGPDLAFEQPVTCPTCLSNLKVVAVEPLELEEVKRQSFKQGRQNFPPRNSPGRRFESPGGRPSNNPANPVRDRRPIAPPPLVVPPNPEKQVNGKRAQKWERPKQEVEEEEVEEYEELENKLIRKHSGKGKHGK